MGYVTVQEAAARRGVPLQTVYSAIREGRLPSHTILGRKVVPVAQLDTLHFGRGGPRPGSGRRRKEQAE